MNFINVNKISLLYFFFFLLFFSSCKKEPVFDKNGWELTFNEEFSDTVLNRKIWKTDFPWGQSSSSENIQYFSDTAFLIKEGILHIQAKRDTVMGLVHDDAYNYFYNEFYLTSGLLQSGDGFSQQYGYFEIRSKVPFGTGFWPAFWLMPHTGWPPEIDIFEISGREPNRLHMSNHFRNKNGDHKQTTTTINGPDFSKDFHLFAIEWNPEKIIWYLDNIKVFQIETCVPNERMYLILSLGLSGSDFFAGELDDKTPMPNSFDIDYVRVYKKVGPDI